MSQHQPLSVEQFLSPISQEKPAGEDLRWSDEFIELVAAMESDEDTADPGVWSRQRKRANWDKVIEVGTSILLEKSKDLRIAAWLTDAWSHLHGLAGMRDGLELMRAIQAKFWENAHPEHGDLDLRRGLYEVLDDPKQLPLRIRNVPLTRVAGASHLSYSIIKHQESRKNDNELRKKDLPDEERAFLEQSIHGGDFDKAVDATARTYYVDLIRELQDCRDAVDRFDNSIKQRWPSSSKERPPQLSTVKAAIEDVAALAKQLLAKKPAEEADDEPDAERERPPEREEEAEESTSDGEASASRETGSTTTSQRSSRSALMGHLTNPDEAIAQIVHAAHFLRQTDPADPVSYLLLRAVGAGMLYRGDNSLDPEKLSPPASEVRQGLYQLFKAGETDEWAKLLDESEEAVGRPEGRGWLDPQLYSVRALQALGFERAARACKTILAAFLRDHTTWIESYLRDGTPCASKATHDWIAAEHLVDVSPTDLAQGVAEQRQESGRQASSDGRAESPADASVEEADPWQQAQLLRRSGRLNEAISVMVQAVRQARTGRDRFLRTLQQAELCLSFDRPGLALPLLEFLAQRIDELRLDQWEDTSLCARVLSHLYRCLKGRDEARALVVYNRLCQLDAGEAILLGAP
jgi:type VI secretion system ImpA family protein